MDEAPGRGYTAQDTILCGVKDQLLQDNMDICALRVGHGIHLIPYGCGIDHMHG